MDGGRAGAASGSYDETIRIWDPNSGNVLPILEGHADEVNSIAWTADGRALASGSYDRTILIWDPNTGKILRALQGHADRVRSVAWTVDGSALASASDDATIRIWDPNTGKIIRTLEGHENWVRSVAWTADGRTLASGSDDQTIRIWNANTGKTLRTLKGHADWVWSVAWTADGRLLASGSADETTRIWDSNTGKTIRTLKGHAAEVRSVAWTADGRTLASGSDDKTIRIWDPNTGKTLRTLRGHASQLSSVAWTVDGRALAFSSGDNTVRISDTNTGKTLRTLQGHRDWVTSVAWTADGRALASGSADKTIRIWDPITGKALRTLEGHTDDVRSVAWTGKGRSLASCSDDGTIRIWDPNTDETLQTLVGHTHRVTSVSGTADGRGLASGSYDKTIRIWDPITGQTVRILEGHTDTISGLAWSHDSEFLASCGENGELRLWRVSDGKLVASRESLSYRHRPVALSFGNAPRLPDSLGEDEIITRLWRPAAGHDAEQQLSIISAKVVLVGDSDAGKSCLALRLAENRFEERGSTFGMQIWPMPAEQLHPSAAPPSGEQREVFLWDLGGQAEYQLVHQLFLHDTTAALVLFDSTRGEANYAAVEDWNRRLDLQARGRQIRKLLVRSKLDLAGGVVNQQRLDQLKEQCHFADYYEVSALNSAGLQRLRHDLNAALAWDQMAKISRPASYQNIRDAIQEERKRTAVVFYSELEKRLGSKDLDTVLSQLALEGQIVDVRLAQGDRVLVLRIDAVSRYASSLILAARDNRRGVPMLEPQRILSADMAFPGMKDEQRLDRLGEKVVLECVVQLLLERGICLEHAGILVFPTLFPSAPDTEAAALPHPRPLYYDFDGPIDNIYAALVARLAASGEFGGVRLWSTRAEYEQSGQGVFAVGRKDRGRGKGRLDLYVSADAGVEKRDLFISFVEDHLRGQSVKVVEGLAFDCDCGKFRFDEDLLRGRLDDQKDDVKCPRCERLYPLFRTAPETPESAKRLFALKTETDRRSRQKVAEVKQAMAAGAAGSVPETPIRLLHLSDLHLTGDRSVEQLLQPLDTDLRDQLKADRLDYLVVSGDLADRCNPAGFERAGEFLQTLMKRFGLNASRLILVPGNHDLDRERDVYKLELNKQKAEAVPAARRVQQGEVFLIRNETEYPKRFELFRNCYKGLTQEDYPEPHENQGLVISYPDDGLEFLTLNSAWQIDRFHADISINSDALSKALLKMKPGTKLRIAVWHHALTGNRIICNQENIKRVIKGGCRICLHGDVHEERNDLLNHLDPQRSFHVVGVGSFSSSDPGLPYATPRLYNLLEIDRTFGRIWVRSRSQRSIDADFEPFAIYPGGDADVRRGDYWINL